jgi:hypothetical protein
MLMAIADQFGYKKQQQQQENKTVSYSSEVKHWLFRYKMRCKHLSAYKFVGINLKYSTAGRTQTIF